jgi:hypothetical protein
VLDAARRTTSVQVVVVVTTDKVYAQRDGAAPYVEDDPLGGYDPYSASKAAAEIVAASYRSSFFSGEPQTCARVATARAGNVIGGGDWAVERLCLTASAHLWPDVAAISGRGAPMARSIPCQATCCPLSAPRTRRQRYGARELDLMGVTTRPSQRSRASPLVSGVRRAGRDHLPVNPHEAGCCGWTVPALAASLAGAHAGRFRTRSGL